MSTATTRAPDDAPGRTHGGRVRYLREGVGLGGARPTLKQRVKRALLYALLTWAVPLALSLVPHDGPVAVPFVFDIEIHVRGLVAVPLLLLVEWPIANRLREIMHLLASPPLTRGSAGDVVKARIRWARRVASHPIANIVLVVLAFAFALQWLRAHEVGPTTWVSTPHGGAYSLTPAGAWAVGVSVPVYAFLLLRWLWRWALLGVLFFRVSFLRLRLVPSHADRAAGLSIVSETGFVFAWVLMSASSVASAKCLNAIVHAGAPPSSFLGIVQGLTALGVVCAFLPLVAFTPRLIRAKRLGLRRYGSVVHGHGLAVKKGWPPPAGRVPSEDASSTADLNAVYEGVRLMRLAPIRVRHVAGVAAAVILPMTPVILLAAPLPEIVAALLKALV